MSENYRRNDPEVQGGVAAQLVAHGYVDNDGEASEFALTLAIRDECMKARVKTKRQRPGTAISFGTVMERVLPLVPMDFDAQTDPALAEAIFDALKGRITRNLALSRTGPVQSLLLEEGLVLCHTKVSRDNNQAIYVTDERKLIEQDAFGEARTKATNAMKFAAGQAAAFGMAINEEDAFGRILRATERKALAASRETFQLTIGTGDEENGNGDEIVAPETEEEVVAA